MMLSEEIIEYGKRVAERGGLSQKHSALIIHRGVIIAEGINYGGVYKSGWYAVHAEVAAINKVRSRGVRFLRECSILCVRVSSCKEGVMSKPCVNCARVINEMGIRRVYYTSGGDGLCGVC